MWVLDGGDEDDVGVLAGGLGMGMLLLCEGVLMSDRGDRGVRLD